MLDKFRVNAKDRTYHFLERNSLGIELYSHAVFMQTLEYVHWNPVKAGLCSLPEAYYYSSDHTGAESFSLVAAASSPGWKSNKHNIIVFTVQKCMPMVIQIVKYTCYINYLTE